MQIFPPPQGEVNESAAPPYPNVSVVIVLNQLSA
jgi:hypothetical protein